MARALHGNVRLTALNLAGNPLGDGANALGDALRVNGTLNSLDISSCALTAASIEHLCTALIANTGVRHLDMSRNYAGEAGGRAIAALIERNQVLLRLMVPDNEMPERVCDRIAEVFAAVSVEAETNYARLAKGDETKLRTMAIHHFVFGGQSRLVRPHCNVVTPHARQLIRDAVARNRRLWERRRMVRRQPSAPTSAAASVLLGTSSLLGSSVGEPRSMTLDDASGLAAVVDADGGDSDIDHDA
jgi:hypothetical protein